MLKPFIKYWHGILSLFLNWTMKKRYFFGIFTFIIIATFIACANGGNAPGPHDSTDNSLPTKVDSDSIKNAFTDTLHDSKDTMHP